MELPESSTLQPQSNFSSKYETSFLLRHKYLLGIFIIIIAAFLLVIINQKYFFPAVQPEPVAKEENNQKMVVYKPPLVKPSDQSLQQGPYTCPVKANYCQNKKNFQGDKVAFNLKSTKLFAIFDGSVDSLKSSHPVLNNSALNNSASGEPEEYSTILLTNLDRGLQAMYYFKGEANIRGLVKEGQLIATSSGQPIEFMEGNSLVFQLIKGASAGGILVTLSPNDFKK